MPKRMPALGLSAVPLPTKTRMKSAIGFAVNPPVADAFEDTTALLAAAPISGSPLIVVEAADLAVAACEPSSRLLAASAAQASGPAAGTPPPLPVPSHDSRLPLTPATAPREGATVMTGAAAAGTPADSAADADVAEEDPGATGTSWDIAAGAVRAEVSIGEDGAGVESVAGTDSRALSGAGTSSTTTGAELLRPFGGVAVADPPGVSALGEEDPLLPASGAESVSEPAADPRAPPRAAADRDPPRVALVLDPESDAAEAVEPAEPVVSAKATGIDATAEPTPRATARAPTRPT